MVFSPIWHGKPPSLVQKSPVNMANSCTSEECRTFLGGGSKHVSKHEPFQAPNPHRSFRYSTPENYVKIGLRNKSPLSAESVIKSFYNLCLSFFANRIKSPYHFIQWELYTCTNGMGSSSWFGVLDHQIICQGSLSSHPTIEKRHQSALADQSC